MKLDDLMKLVNAGFTKDDILSLSKATDTVAETKAETTAETKAETVAEKKFDAVAEKKFEATAEKKADTMTHFDFAKAFNDLQVSIAKLTDSAIANNINASAQPSVSEVNVEKILKGIF